MRATISIHMIESTILRIITRFIAVAGFALAAFSPHAATLPFSLENSITTGLFPRAESVAVGDMNRDGIPDVVGANTNSIFWWKNMDDSGTNWLGTAVDESFPSANSIFIIDVDGDGDEDIAGAAGGNADVVAWWENEDGLGTNWIKHVVDAAIDGARSISSADIDGDGHPDLLAPAFTADQIVWWKNLAGSGTNWFKFIVTTDFDGATSARSADIDRDGDLDIVGTSGNDHILAWWENLGGQGTNWTLHTIDTAFNSAQNVDIGDLDGDGDLDLVGSANIIASSADHITWWENLDETGGSWTSRLIAAGFDGAYGLFVFDLDGDGDRDVLATAQTDNDVAWFENITGQGLSWNKHTVDGLFSGARSIYPGDLDGDGDPDIVAAAFTENKLAWWENLNIHRSASFCITNPVATGFVGAQSIAPVDLDRDGDLDIIGAASVNNRISWWENGDGQGGVWLERSIDTNVPSAWAILSGDINNDGIPDVIGSSRSTGTISWWKDEDGSGQNWNRYVIETNFIQVQSAAVADLDRDGDVDVVGAAYGSGEIGCWINSDPSGTNWIKHIIATGYSGANAVITQDINGDGQIDIIGSSFTLGHITWWKNNGESATNWTAHIIDDAFSGSMAVDVLDVDRDGDADVIGASFNLDRITWWENLDGTGTNWTSHVVDQQVDGASAVRADDLDGDGDIDIFGGSSVINRFAWWENADGSNTNWIRYDLAVDTLDAAAVAAADLDGDGMTDILGASGSDPYIVWWKNGGGQFAVTATNTLPSILFPGSTAHVQTIAFMHRGRPMDSSVELSALSLLLEYSPGLPLTTAEANQMTDYLRVYRDTGSGNYEPDTDILVHEENNLLLNAGVQIISLADGEPQAECGPGQTNLYFMVLAFSTNAGNQSHNTIAISLLNEDAMAEDREHDIPLKRECGTDIVAGSSMLITYADVSIGLNASPNPLELDSNLVYSITVSNRSPDHAWQVVVTDTPPALVAFNAAASSPDCFEWDGKIICNAGTITGHQARILTVAVTVSGSAIGAITNHATAAAWSIDTNTADNSASIAVLIPDTDTDADPDFNDPDDDNDGMPDDWELWYGFDRIDDMDAAENPDDDGFTNLEEFLADTNPTNGLSFFAVEGIGSITPVTVYIPASTGRVYSLEHIENHYLGVWSNVNGQVNLPGNGSILMLLDTNAAVHRGYRVKVSLPPE